MRTGSEEQDRKGGRRRGEWGACMHVEQRHGKEEERVVFAEGGLLGLVAFIQGGSRFTLSPRVPVCVVLCACALCLALLGLSLPHLSPPPPSPSPSSQAAMIVRTLLALLRTLSIVAVLASLLIHNYARISCHWHWRRPESFLRMVVIADPQMEGDAKIARLGKRGSYKVQELQC